MAIIQLLLLLSAFSAPGHLRTFFTPEKKIACMFHAQETCKNLTGNIVTVYNDDENAKLAQRVQRAWIGLFRNQSSYKWSNGDHVTFDNSIHSMSPCCTAMKADGSWECLDCRERRNFMCYKQDVSSQNLSYHSVLENKTWYEAQTYCRKNYTDLVTIKDQNQNETVKKEGKNSSTSFWIGLLFDDFEWADGGHSAYRNWATGQPRESSNCTVMMVQYAHESGKWYSVPCTNQEFALCRNTTGIN